MASRFILARGRAGIGDDLPGYPWAVDFRWHVFPLRHEIANGYETVEWASAAPYGNGKVGMLGASYVGATQWLAAFDGRPYLTAIISAITVSD